MAAFKGTALLLKIGDGATPEENFTTLGGMRATVFKVQRQILANSDLTTGRWRSLLAEGGTASVKIQGNGLVLNETADVRLRQQAMNGKQANYEIFFGNGDRLTGAFVLSQYECQGNLKDAERFALSLESAGLISLIEA